MYRIESKINTGSEQYKENREANLRQVEELREQTAEIR